MNEATSSSRRKLRSKRRQSEYPCCPEKPPVPNAPSVKVAKSTFADDWYKTLQESKFHDVTFNVANARQLHAHKVILCASSPVFEKLLTPSFPNKNSEKQAFSENEAFMTKDLNAGLCDVHEGETTCGNHMTVITLSSDIKEQTFTRFLKFLYTGRPVFDGDSNLRGEEAVELKHLSTLFEVPHFDTVCDNILRREEFLNTNIIALFNHQQRSRLKSLFLNQSQYADVVFHVDSRKVFAHKVILCTRCDVMAAMFSGHFSEGRCEKLMEIAIPETSHENFFAFLEYLYTDHAPLKQLPHVTGLLALADEKNQQRLMTLCELYISRVMDKLFHDKNKTEVDSDLDVIGLLKTAQILNAQQLVDWCLHLISVNYEEFSKKREFLSLALEDRTFVENNRWPPLHYLTSLEAYKLAIAARGRRRKYLCAIT